MLSQPNRIMLSFFKNLRIYLVLNRFKLINNKERTTTLVVSFDTSSCPLASIYGNTVTKLQWLYQ